MCDVLIHINTNTPKHQDAPMDILIASKRQLIRYKQKYGIIRPDPPIFPDHLSNVKAGCLEAFLSKVTVVLQPTDSFLRANKCSEKSALDDL